MATKPPSKSFDITSEDIPIEQLLSRNVRYHMPDYQRRQAWDKQQFRALFSDVATLPDDSFTYLNAIKTQPQGVFDDAAVADVDVVDGQQRLIACCLTLAVGRDVLEAQFGESAHARRIDNYLRVDTPTIEDTVVQLTPLDDPQFQTLLDDTTASVDHAGFTSLVEAVRERFEQFETAADLKGFLKRYLNNQIVTHTRVGAEFSGYDLFDTHNAKRNNPGPVDRVKTLVMQTAANRTGVDKDAVEEQWYKIRTALNQQGVSEIRFWQYWIMSNDLYPVTCKVSKGTLFEEVDAIIRDRMPTDRVGLADFLTETADAAGIYRNIATASVDSFGSATNNTVNYHLRRIDTIGAKPARILVLRAIREGIDGNDLIHLLERLEKFTFPRRVTDKRVPNEVRAYITVAHNGFDGGTDLFELVETEFDPLTPTAVEFREAFASENWRAGKTTKYVLSTLEAEYFNPTGSPFGDEYPDMGIEYVAPRRTFDAKKYTQWRSELDVGADKFDLINEKIGNITLYEGESHRKPGPDPISEKQSLYSDSSARMAQEVADRPDWSKRIIDERSEMLADIATRVWQL